MKKPRYVICDYDRLGKERIYFREPGKRKIRLRGPLFSDEFWADYVAARSGELKPAPPAEPRKGSLPAAGTFDRLCVEYYQSADFRRLNPDTRYRRRLTLDPLREEFGKLPAGKLEAKHIRKMRDARADKPHSANALIKSLRQVYTFGVEYGYVRFNPARDVKLLKGSVDGFHTWTPDELAQYRDRFPLGTQPRLAFDLMLYTGVRRGDACRLGRQHMAGDKLVFTPQKGAERKAKRLTIPIHPALAESIAATPGDSLAFLVTEHGRPWGNAGSFGNAFKKWCKEAGLPHCSAHGLRKAATVMLIDAGCSAAQASAITGHDSLKVLEHYARERDRERLADDAMALLLNAESSEKVPHDDPLDSPMPLHGTIAGSNLLKGKGSKRWMAPRAGKKAKKTNS